MKTCPICQASAFDDAKTCFGCMHPFDDASQKKPAHEKDRDGGAPSRFVVSFTPVLENGKTIWACSVEQAAC